MLEFIAQYWLTFLLGTIAGGLTFLCKKFWKLYQSEKNHQKTKEQEEFYADIKQLITECTEESRNGDKLLQDQIDIIRGGILSIQRKDFKEDCESALREGHEVSLEEFESLQEEHKIYHSLGGNHDGDTLFDMVRKKAAHNLADK